MEHVLVTGGAGYIGSVLVGELLDAGCAVTVLDSFLYGHQSLAAVADHPHLVTIEADIRDELAVADAVRGCDWVVHLAGIVGYPACEARPDEADAVNLQGTRNLLDAMAADQRLLFASTLSVYGAVEDRATEDTPLAPLSRYGRHKAECEQMIRDDREEFVILRLATLFGVSPRLRLDLLVNDLVFQAMRKRRVVLYEGHFRRAFLHVRDASAAYRFAMEHYETLRGGTFNVGNEHANLTKRQLAQAIARHVDYELDESPCGKDLDQRDYAVDCTRLRAAGYEAAIDLDTGIAELVQRYQDFDPDDSSCNA